MTVQHIEAPPEAALSTYQDAAVERLATWAQSAKAAYQVAQSLVKTSFVPVAFRDKPHEATAAILAGMEIGLSPMSALKSFDVIAGQAAPRAITLRAVVQSHGHEVTVKESNATRCVMTGRRRGSNTVQTVTWTIDRARDLGLLAKDQWKKQPTAMLVARATSEICRLTAADAILGIGYSAEELADGTDPNAPIDTPAEAATEPTPLATRRMSRRKPTEPTANDDGEPLRNEGQSAKMHALFGELGITDRDEKLKWASDVLGREVDTTKTLTVAEASLLIDELERTRPATPPDFTDPSRLADVADEQAPA